MAGVRVGIVGIGFGQRVLAPAFRAHPRCEVAAICASTPERAASAAARLGVPTAYGDWRELVADSRIDAVAIAVPPALQPAIGIAAAEQGKHLFCEKPVAAALEPAEALLAAAARAGIVHLVDFEFPAVEAWQQARRLIVEGALGRVRQAAVTWHLETRAQRRGQRSWKASASDGGGALLAFGSHILYNVEWLLGPVQRLRAWLQTPEGAPGDVAASLWLELDGGARVTVALSTAARAGSGHRVEVYGDAGGLRLENPGPDHIRGFTLIHGDGARETVVSREDAPASVDEDGRLGAVTRQVARFVESIERRRPAAPNLEDGCRIQRLLEAARVSDRREGWRDVAALAAAP